MARKKYSTLTEQMYYILLALKEECCGVEVSNSVKKITHERLLIGPGTLYTLLGDFEKEGLIEVVRVEGRSKWYRITEEGNLLVTQEYQRLKRQVEDGSSFFEVAFA